MAELDQRFGTEVAEQKPVPGAQLDWGEKSWDGKPSKKTADFAGVTILQLYIFLWKMLAANLLFALPFAIIYFLVIAR